MVAFEVGPEEMFDAQDVLTADEVFGKRKVGKSVSVFDFDTLLLLDTATRIDELKEGGPTLFEGCIGLLAEEDRTSPDGVPRLVDGLVGFDQGAELAAFAEIDGGLLCEGGLLCVEGLRFGGALGVWCDRVEGELIFECAGAGGGSGGAFCGAGFGGKACDGWFALGPVVGCGVRFNAAVEAGQEQRTAQKGPQGQALGRARGALWRVGSFVWTDGCAFFVVGGLWWVCAVGWCCGSLCR